MKKKMISFSLILSAVLLFSCTDNNGTSASDANNNGGTGATGADGTTNTTNTATDTGTAGTATTGMATTANNVGEMDKQFMMEAASGGMMEVELGRMASQTASHDRVKNFGNMMVQDHTNANNELKALASSKNVMLPDSMMAKHRNHINSMKKKTGKEFDKAYMGMMVQDHNEDVSNFQKASTNGQDADVKAFASKTLPVLRGHLDSAKAINMAVKK